MPKYVRQFRGATPRLKTTCSALTDHPATAQTSLSLRLSVPLGPPLRNPLSGGFSTGFPTGPCTGFSAARIPNQRLDNFPDQLPEIFSRRVAPMQAIDPRRFAPHELLDAEQVGEWFNCSRKAARNWLNQHGIRKVNAPGRTHRFRAGDIQAELAESQSGIEAGSHA